MTSRGRLTLALAAAALIAAAIYLSTAARRTQRPAGVGDLLYPSLEASLDEVKAIRILGEGGSTAVTLERAASGWTVAERAGFPADSGRVRTLLLALAQARTVEQKTSTPDNYPSLGVEELTADGATGTGVELEGPATAVSLIVGKSTGTRSTFVRRKGESASWQIGTALTVERDPAQWLATELLDIGADRVQSAEVAVGKQRPWKAAKTSRADLDFRVTGRLAGGKSAPAADASAPRVGTALAGLRLTDVQRAPAPATDKPAATATYRTFDGLVLSIDGYTDGEKRYVRVRPSVDESAPARYFTAAAQPAAKDAGAGTTPPQAPGGSAPPAASGNPAAAASTKPAEGSTPEAPAQTPESVLARTREEAARLETRLEGWRFEIPSWNYDAIFP